MGRVPALFHLFGNGRKLQVTPVDGSQWNSSSRLLDDIPSASFQNRSCVKAVTRSKHANFD